MSLEDNDNSQNELWRRYHRQHRPKELDEERGRFFQLRQLLNVFFLILSVLGMGLWYIYSPEIGGIALIAAVACKFIELSLRIMKL